MDTDNNVVAREKGDGDWVEGMSPSAIVLRIKIKKQIIASKRKKNNNNSFTCFTNQAEP